MRRILFVLGFLLVMISLSVSLPYFPLRELRFDLIWLLVLYLSFTMSYYRGALVVFYLGWLQESIATALHGLLLIPYLGCYFLLRLGCTHLFFEGVVVQALWVFILTLARQVMECFLLTHLGGSSLLFFPMILESLLQALASMILFPLLKNWLKEEVNA